MPLRDRIVFTGRVPEDEVVDTLNAMDVGFITQTLDELGSYRLTTKLPEYPGLGTARGDESHPRFCSTMPAAGWPLPAHHPAREPFHRKCAAWVDLPIVERCSRKAPKGASSGSEIF